MSHPRGKVIQLCPDCGCSRSAHFTYCVRFANAAVKSAAFLPKPPTAYEREQAPMLERIARLELEVARLKAWSRPPTEMCLKCGTGFTTPEHVESHRCSP